MLQIQRNLTFTAATESDSYTPDFDGEEMHTNKGPEQDFIFIVDGPAATYTVQISLNGTDYVDFDAGTAVALNTPTQIRAKDVLANYIRLKSSIAVTGTVAFIAKRG